MSRISVTSANKKRYNKYTKLLRIIEKENEMARILCLCGETLSNSESPNDIEIYCFPDRQFFELTESGQTDFENIADVDPEITIWKCPSCGRLLLFKGDSNRPVVYKIEKDFTQEE